MEKIPTSDMSNFYLFIGGFIVLNIGTIITVTFTLLKVSFQLGQAKATLDKVAKDVDIAHQFIREIRDGK